MSTAAVAPTPDDPEIRAAFEQFLAAYPRQEPERAVGARDAFREACGLVSRPELLVAAAALFAARVKEAGTEPRFVPNPGRWLRERRYEDYAPCAAPATVGATVRVGTQSLALDIPSGDADHVFRTLSMVIRAAAHGGRRP